MKALLAVLLALPIVAQAGEDVLLWHCPGDVFTDRPCNGGYRVTIDTRMNLIAAETRRPKGNEGPSRASVLMIPRPAPATFEPPPTHDSGFVFSPSMSFGFVP